METNHQPPRPAVEEGPRDEVCVWCRGVIALSETAREYLHVGENGAKRDSDHAAVAARPLVQEDDASSANTQLLQDQAQIRPAADDPANYCDTCDDTGWIVNDVDDSGPWRVCPQCNESGNKPSPFRFVPADDPRDEDDDVREARLLRLWAEYDSAMDGNSFQRAEEARRAIETAIERRRVRAVPQAESEVCWFEFGRDSLPRFCGRPPEHLVHHGHAYLSVEASERADDPRDERNERATQIAKDAAVAARAERQRRSITGDAARYNDREFMARVESRDDPRDEDDYVEAARQKIIEFFADRIPAVTGWVADSDEFKDAVHTIALALDEYGATIERRRGVARDEDDDIEAAANDALLAFLHLSETHFNVLHGAREPAPVEAAWAECNDPFVRLKRAIERRRVRAVPPIEWEAHEGMVTVYDHEGHYLGCMGTNTWRDQLRAQADGVAVPQAGDVCAYWFCEHPRSVHTPGSERGPNESSCDHCRSCCEPESDTNTDCDHDFEPADVQEDFSRGVVGRILGVQVFKDRSPAAVQAGGGDEGRCTRCGGAMFAPCDEHPAAYLHNTRYRTEPGQMNACAIAGHAHDFEAQAGGGDEPSYSEVLAAAGEAVPMSGDVHEDARRMEAFVLGATWEYNRAGGGLRAAALTLADAAHAYWRDDSRDNAIALRKAEEALRALVATPQGEKE